MQSTQKILLAGVGAIVIGAIVAVALGSGEETREVAERKFDPKQRANRLTELSAAEEVPEEMKGAERYLDERFGHLTDDNIVAPTTDNSGKKFFLDPKVYAGWGQGNKRVYARAIARPMYDEKVKLVNLKDDLDKITMVRAKVWEKSEFVKRVQGIKHIKPGDDLPDELGGGTNDSAWKLPPAGGN